MHIAICIHAICARVCFNAKKWILVHDLTKLAGCVTIAYVIPVRTRGNPLTVFIFGT